MKLHALGGELVHDGRFDVRAAVGAEEGVAVVVAEEEKDVRLGRKGRNREGEGRKENEDVLHSGDETAMGG